MSQQQSPPPRPLPQIDPDHLPWWEGLRRHELLVQECPACRRCVFPPQPACPYCRSLERGWRRSSGRGKVYSWVTVRRASHPWFADKIPFAAVLVGMVGVMNASGGTRGIVDVFRKYTGNRRSAQMIASIMGMNNVYYRFLHLVEDAEYQSMPARLRPPR